MTFQYSKKLPAELMRSAGLLQKFIVLWICFIVTLFYFCTVLVAQVWVLSSLILLNITYMTPMILTVNLETIQYNTIHNM
jgi:uncharacterized membrane protein